MIIITAVVAVGVFVFPFACVFAFLEGDPFLAITAPTAAATMAALIALGMGAAWFVFRLGGLA